ncbi:MAG: hypothetical protein AB7H90_08890 [Alphaproteobacteria bacterium]
MLRNVFQRGALIVLALVGSRIAAAENTTEALKVFGLLGTWSYDCVLKPKSGDRFTVEAKIFSVPTLTPVGGTAIPILSAVRVTEEKIKLTLGEQPGHELVLQKQGNKVLMDNASAPVHWPRKPPYGPFVLEKCLH